MKSFVIPEIYKSNIIGKIKEARRSKDKLKKDFTPTVLDFGTIKFLIARHFGFCYGVENAVEIAYKTIRENPDKRIFFLSEMIHNPDVNADLLSQGVKFLMDTKGNQLIDWSELKPEDAVVVPAFGTTIEIQQQLTSLGIDPYKYDTTCPFVEKVWNRAGQIGERGYSIVVHGKPKHEETRATFSHSKQNAPTVVVNDMKEAEKLAKYITRELPKEQFYEDFAGQYSEGFDPEKDLDRIGVVNQTTMLASDTQSIADFLKQVITKYHNAQPNEVERYFANTRDTLCYATNDNQEATYALLENQADLAVVVGGYNSSNTSHLVELCEEKLPTYFIQSHESILDKNLVKRYNLHKKQEITDDFLPEKPQLTVMLTCGASCPDAVMEAVLLKILSFFNTEKEIDELLLTL
ncbi:hydroxymethylbutenyl pyrophosphate reductase [Emticicia oligotrophica DSM 17448]|uniref:Hydroxymethylbutenyl pyrophosphate reductase n=1 Tax=Emticicia oligotrophica (strain DSM 17448 / CIP 109782 / MTCC 6937 / GPTSA100-15) TaxID=929562 RepID=A0ABN4AJ55_EMTOG|nr:MULTISPECIES: 4-hydroxy-3-methylbut-2-enyl diphosphate reductase [Emticicia]AFK02063.1 hydroxymethylbutenyl pyrophosphate reductase [Emticicia oligotrophica DSM 17448]